MKKIIIAAAATGLIGNALGGLQGDSVMSPNGVLSSSTIQQNMGTVQTPAISSSNSNEIQWGTCPAGFNYQGSSVYPLQTRSLTTYYMNGKETGTSASGWTDLDSSCTKTEYQTIACPSGYTGNQQQSRLVATKDGNALDYGSWNTYQINCQPAEQWTCIHDDMNFIDVTPSQRKGSSSSYRMVTTYWIYNGGPIITTYAYHDQFPNIAAMSLEEKGAYFDKYYQDRGYKYKRGRLVYQDQVAGQPKGTMFYSYELCKLS